MAGKKSLKNNQLYTKWGENLNENEVLLEYPRPGLRRKSYKNLNGIWKYAITQSARIPEWFDGDILVPFSPESILSKVRKQIKPNEYLWYYRELTIEPEFVDKRIILHFGAVDQYCRVYLNGVQVAKHKGGYLPFSADITNHIQVGLDVRNELIVMVRDTSDTSYHARGKQRLRRGGMFYTAQSGIWQTVWMESVPETYVERLKITPQYDKEMIYIQIILNSDQQKQKWNADMDTADGIQGTENLSANRIQVYQDEQKILSKRIGGRRNLILSIPDVISWSPEHPFLYTFTLNIGEDVVESYFAMRKFSVGKDSQGKMRLMLNNQVYFHNGVLDQGYWSDGLYTAPSDEALIYDIKSMKELGFNMIRKHIKIEPQRWYYHCDKLGMLVWQDMVNGGGNYNYSLVTLLPALFFNSITSMKDHRYKLLARENARGKHEFEQEMKETVKLLYNIPSIAMWVPFNEGWGQFDAVRITKLLQELDCTRTIDHASGWFDQKAGDVKSIHIYFRKIRIRPDSRAVVMSEFGGYICRIPGHSFNRKVFGYKIFKKTDDLLKGYIKLYQEGVKPAMKDGLSAAVYTQLSDVEDEVNGILTYDRKIMKLDAKRVKKLNQELADEKRY